MIQNRENGTRFLVFVVAYEAESTLMVGGSRRTLRDPTRFGRKRRNEGDGQSRHELTIGIAPTRIRAFFVHSSQVA